MLRENICLFTNAIIIVILILSGSYSCKNTRQQNTLQKDSVTKGLVPPKIKNTKENKYPRLAVKDGKDRDMGRIREGIKTIVTYTLINEGEADASNISIHDLSKGGCTAVTQVSRLATGDSAELKFIFETLGYGGRKEIRKIEVRYDNPDYSPITLSVTAEVLPTEKHQVPIGELFYNFFVLVDIRDEADFRKGHIAGAINIPEDELLAWASALPKDFIIYLCSEDGEASDSLAKKMQNNGYEEALSIIGGIEEWKRMYGERVIIKGTR